MEKRLILPTILSIILLAVAVGLSFLPVSSGNTESDLIPIYPGNVLSDVILTIVIPYIILILVLILGPFIVISLIKMHKLMKLNKYDYFVVKNEKDLPASRIILRSIFPGLLAVNIGIYVGLSSTLAPLIVTDPENRMGAVEYGAVIIGMPIATILILPLWMLESSGLTCKKRVEEYNRPVSPDIEGVGAFYLQMIKGYVGISTVISYTVVLITVYESGTAEIWLLFVDPIIVMFLLLPGSLLVELRAKKTTSQLGSYYQKAQIDATPKTIKIE